VRWSKAFIPTLRDPPADAEAPSHKLLVRGGFVRQLGAGLYELLPLGRQVLLRIERIVRQEMSAIGGQEFLLPALHPAELWQESGRWGDIGSEMFRLRDRKEADLCLGMTAEEIFADVARGELRSYRQLPQIWFQIQNKFRDEPRPKSGVLRTRQFTMKDSYSFDLDWEGLDRAFQLHREAYHSIFSRCGLDVITVEASSGTMGGKESVEFISLSDTGEDQIARCSGCGYAANLEKATSVPEAVEDPEDSMPTERFATPGVRTIEELARFAGGAPPERQVKTLLYIANEKPVIFLIRGDDELNEVKAGDAVGADLRPARPEEIRQALAASAGSLGAVGVESVPVYADERLRGRRGMTTGANEDGFHLRHVDVERDIPSPRWVGLREVRAGEPCAKCGTALEVKRGIEVGHIFKLGLRYSEAMGVRVLNADGKEVPMVMGSYGIGLERLMAAVVERHHDDDGIRWPIAIAPYEAVIVPVKVTETSQSEVAERIYEELRDAGVRALLDDRDERPGVKFKDADLVGIPYRIVVGPRALARGNVEIVRREGGESVQVPKEQASTHVAGEVA
jgi:prolyl-tRNA synthetase